MAAESRRVVKAGAYTGRVIAGAGRRSQAVSAAHVTGGAFFIFLTRDALE